MSNRRPVNLDIATIRLPITAYASILHRISGVALFFVAAGLLWLLDTSLSSPTGFAAVRECLDGPFARFLLWGSLVALGYHFAAGIRHLVMDLGVGESLEGGRRGARWVFAATAVLAVLAGIWLW
ncbi:MAG: succinate dehydrogenase subunit C [Porticoccaceae bacterium]|nr:MAG: succinate dehydrogenase subunit C [Porticoccaceae bacterium]